MCRQATWPEGSYKTRNSAHVEYACTHVGAHASRLSAGQKDLRRFTPLSELNLKTEEPGPCN